MIRMLMMIKAVLPVADVPDYGVVGCGVVRNIFYSATAVTF